MSAGVSATCCSWPPPCSPVSSSSGCEGAPTPARIAAWVAIAIVALSGLPTTVIDIYNTQDLSNRNEAPGFRWTLVLTPDDRQVFDWIRHNTRPDAVFQVDPLVRDSETWAYLPAFAERRMAVGLPISMVPLRKYQEGSEQVRTIFDEAPLSAYERAVRSGINYIIVGPPERDGAPGRRAAIRFARPVDAGRVSQRHHLDLRSRAAVATGWQCLTG